MSSMDTAAEFGALLRSWRTERRLSQADLANHIETPSRHISFLETGRAGPSRSMVARLASALRVPILDRNLLPRAAGFADVHPEHDLSDVEMSELREALTRMMNAQSPCPSFVVDRGWNVVDANEGGRDVLALVADAFPFDPPRETVDMIDAVFDPAGFRAHMLDWEGYVRQFIQRLHRESASDRELAERFARVRRHAELPEDWWAFDVTHTERPLFPIEMVIDGTPMTFFAVVAAVAMPVSALAQELRVETLFPADSETERLLGVRRGEDAFGPLFLMGAHPATSTPTRLMMDVLGWTPWGGQSFDASTARFLSALAGGLLVGWGATIWILSGRAYDAAPNAVRGAVVVGLACWFVTDSLASVASGHPSNAAFNVFFLVLCVGSMWWPAFSISSGESRTRWATR